MTRRDSNRSSAWSSARQSKGGASNNEQAGAASLYILHGKLEDQRDDVRADIVVIHGLSGHHMGTWTTDDGVCWPKDLLPKMTARIGVTRIMTFGYAAGQLGSKLDLDIEDVAWQLIHRLDSARLLPEQRSRPLIFVVHSLGGLVLKKALNISNTVLASRHILWAVAGIVFLATPHRGSAMADIADKLRRISGQSQRFLKALKSRSPELASICEEFRQIASQRKMPIASFYELHAFNPFPCLNTVIVKKDSAILHIDTEQLYGAERDHRSIARFEDADDDVFQQIVTHIAGFINQGTVSSNARVLVPWDSSSHFKGRRESLQKLHQSFFPVVHPSLGDKSSRRHVAMIYGDGGLGKTELTLKFARENEFRYSYILFAESTSQQTLHNEVANLHAQLGLPPAPGRELQDLREFLRHDNSWLFILDNDNDFLGLNQIRFPEVDHGHILITCRTRDNSTDPRLDTTLPLPPLHVQEARDLLFSRAGITTSNRAEQEEGVTDLVETLGCVPAMVENTAAYMVSFDADVQACLKSMGHKRSRRSIMGYYANASRYKLSAEGLFKIRLDTLRERMPNADMLLSVLVWLDRTNTTRSFFTRSVSQRRLWAANGEIEERAPSSSFVPDELVDMIESPEFNIAMNSLKSSSLIARDEVFNKAMGSKDTFVLHPSLYQFVRDSAALEGPIQAICPALALVVHAHPVLEGGLETSIPLKRQMTYQVQQLLRNIDEVCGSLSQQDLHKAFQDYWGIRSSEFFHVMAEILLESIGNYGDDDDVDVKLISLIETLLIGSTNVALQARLWSKRLPLEYYKHGKLYEGCAAADNFLEKLATETDHTRWSNKDNAEVGTLRALTVEYRLNEPGLTPREIWEKRVEFIEAWQPLDPDQPSSLEHYVVGLGVRMRGKLAKDFGLFEEAYYGLKEFIENYAVRGSREEGWAMGDFGQLVVELEGTEAGSEIHADLAQHGTNFGKKVPLAENTRPCDLVAYVLSTAVDSRMFERGYLTPEARLEARESDTMWLEMIHAMTLVHMAGHAPERYAAADAALISMSKRFERIEAVEAWYDEQIRHFAIKCSMAQVSHMQHNWEDAQARWADAIQYGTDKVGDWKGDHYYVEVARYSLADAQCSGGLDPRDVVRVLGETIERVNGKRIKWMLGMGTFWLDFIHERMVPRIEAVARLQESDALEDKMAVQPVVIQEI